MIALKFLTADDTGPHSGFGWPLPQADKPGKWVAAKGKLVVCRNGIHATTAAHVTDWLDDHAYLIELGGKVIESQSKLCARKGRLLRQLDWNFRLFAADCAKRAFARGEIDVSTLIAARDAAWPTARRGWQAALLLDHLHLTQAEREGLAA